MPIRRILLLGVGIGGMQASPAHAHFLFIRIRPPAEGGRAAEVYFSELASSYRIRDKQIRVVNRHLGKENMTITTLENERNADGKFLPLPRGRHGGSARGRLAAWWGVDCRQPQRRPTPPARLMSSGGVRAGVF